MTSRDFCYWLQGVFEVGDVKQLDARQTELVRRHLALVFKHEIDPSAGPPEHQKELDKIHQGGDFQSHQSDGFPYDQPGRNDVRFRC